MYITWLTYWASLEMSLSLLQPFHKRHHGCVHLLLCLNPMWQLRSCHSTSKLSHLCHCVIQLCQNNIICASCPSLAIAHMFINIESSNRFVPEQTKKSHLSKLVSNKSMHEVCLFSLMDGLVGCWGKNKSWRDKGSVWALWSAGGLWKVLATMSWLCIAGAFTKFAIFENRIFFKRAAAKWNLVQPISFFSRFWYMTLNNKVLCGLMGRK